MDCAEQSKCQICSIGTVTDLKSVQTSPLYQLLVILWLATIFVPNRYLILLWGLYQFFFKFLPVPEDDPITIKFNNFLKSIPNDDDLDVIYESERCASRIREDKAVADRLNKAKTNLALRTWWRGGVMLKSSYSKQNQHPSQTGAFGAAELLLQGRRLVWWDSERDMYCAPPHGQLLLCGHAGVSGPTVIDQREAQQLMTQDQLEDRLLCVFGSDEHLLPAKCTVACASVEDKESLIRAIESIVKS
jgi:hypothetical protein